jgi:hypothetical protein
MSWPVEGDSDVVTGEASQPNFVSLDFNMKLVHRRSGANQSRSNLTH